MTHRQHDTASSRPTLRRLGHLAPLLWLLLLGGVAACTSISCPLEKVTGARCRIYDADTEKEQPIAAEVALTVKPYLRDTVLLNRASSVSDFILPLKATEQADTLLFYFFASDAEHEDETYADTLRIIHTPQPHFESVDCPLQVFHKISSVEWASHPLSVFPVTIDSVAVIGSQVDYETPENLRIYLRRAAEQ